MTIKAVILDAFGPILSSTAVAPPYRMRLAKSSTRPRKAKTWCALKFKWAPVLTF